MALFIVQFEDRSERLDVRQRDIGAHLAFLKAHDDHIKGSGPLRLEPLGDVIGSIWIVQAETKTDIERLVHQDPFWVGGLRKSMHIFYWSASFNVPRIE